MATVNNNNIGQVFNHMVDSSISQPVVVTRIIMVRESHMNNETVVVRVELDPTLPATEQLPCQPLEPSEDDHGNNAGRRAGAHQRPTTQARAWAKGA